jgi:hypothetical protein
VERAGYRDASDAEGCSARIGQLRRLGFTGGEDHVGRKGQAGGRERYRWLNRGPQERHSLRTAGAVVGDRQRPALSAQDLGREAHLDGAASTCRQAVPTVIRLAKWSDRRNGGDGERIVRAERYRLLGARSA